MKTEKIRKAKGSVLFTVVAVMTLLVVFMAGTMILVSSANHRSHINYSTAQTTVTSRTVAESALQALQLSPKNKDYEDYFFSVNKDNPRIEIPVSIDQSEAGAHLGTMGDIENVVVTYEGTMDFYSDGTTSDDGTGDKAEKGWKSRDIIKVMSTVNLGRASSSTAIYLVVDPPNSDPGSGGGGAGFVTTGGADLTCKTSLFGGSYINLPELKWAENFDYTNKGLFNETTNPTGYLSGKTTALKNEGTLVEADAVFNSNLALGDSSGMVFPVKGKGITIWGDLLTSENSGDPQKFNLYVNTANFPVKDGKRETLKFNEVPFIYVDGKITGGGNVQDDGNVSGGKGSMKFELVDMAKNAVTDIPLNVFCSSIDQHGDVNKSIFRADVYCMDETATSEIGSNGADTQLRDWTASVINKGISTDAKDYIGGNFLTNGNLKFTGQKDITIEKDLRIAGDLDLSSFSGTLKVGGDLVIGKNVIGATKEKIQKLDIGGTLYTDAALPGIERSLKSNIEIREEFDDVNFVKVKNKGPYTWDKVELFNENTYPLGFTVKPEDGKTGEEACNWIITNTAGNDYSIPYDPEDENSKDYFYVAPEFEMNNVRDGDFDDSEYYYIEVEKNGVTEIRDEPKTQEFWYYAVTDTSDSPAHVPEEETLVKKYYDTSTGKYVTEKEAYEGTDAKPLDAYKYKAHIYPDYAKKSVLIGKDSVGDIPKKDTKVVMTMQEVLKNVVNPYNNKGYPSQFAEYMANPSPLPVYGDIFELYNDASTKGAGQRTVCTTKFVNNTTFPLEKIEYEKCEPLPKDNPQNYVHSYLKGSYTINSSCILKNFNPGANQFGNQQEKIIVVNPEKADILIVIDEGVNLNDIQFIIDDVSSTNKVYFYIKDNCTLNLTGDHGTITTAKYNALVNSKTAFQIATDSKLLRKEGGEVKPKTLDDLGVTNPTAYVYGGVGSKIFGQNYYCFAANIVSPDIAVEFDGTKNAVSNEIYYNGTPVKLADNGQDIMFGCCNSKNTKFKNVIKVLFTPNTGVVKPPITTDDRSHWLKVLYYDEF